MLANPDDEQIRALLSSSRTIAVIGLSPRPARPSHQVARYLMAAGYRVVPVNPAHDEILGQRCYPDLRAVPEPIDIVDCFRRSNQVEPIAAEAVAVGAKALWLQVGVVNESAAAVAAQGGLTVVMNRCIKVDHTVLGVGRHRVPGPMAGDAPS